MRESKFNKPLCVAFTPDAYSKIKKISDERHIAMAEYVREVIKKALVEEEQELLNNALILKEGS